jgi:hypothetical protein
MWGDSAKRTVKGGTGIIFSVPPFKLFRPWDFTSFFGIFGLLRFSYPIRLFVLPMAVGTVSYNKWCFD